MTLQSGLRKFDPIQILNIFILKIFFYFIDPVDQLFWVKISQKCGNLKLRSFPVLGNGQEKPFLLLVKSFTFLIKISFYVGFILTFLSYGNIHASTNLFL